MVMRYVIFVMIKVVLVMRSVIMIMKYVILVMNKMVLVMRYRYEICDISYEQNGINYDQSGVVMSKKVLIIRYVISSYEICDVGYDKKVLVMRYVTSVMNKMVLVMRYRYEIYDISYEQNGVNYDQSGVVMSKKDQSGVGYEICDYDYEICDMNKMVLVMRYRYEICDISYEQNDVNYDQSGVVMSKKVLIIRFVISSYEICDVDYNKKVLVMRYVTSGYDICELTFPILDINILLDSGHKNETPVLIAAKNGIVEIVEGIVGNFPMAVHDTNSDGKGVVLLAVENRQTILFQYLLERFVLRDTNYYEVDNDGNSALHLAAKISDRSWLIPGSKMRWEIKWYEFIEKSMPVSFRTQYNKDRQTPNEIFMKEHKDLVKEDTQWLMKTSDSCVIAATLIASVAFATSASVPGGVNQDNGVPVLIQQRMFDVFSISSLAALCFSLTALIIFLAILTTQHQAMDFGHKLPRMLLIGLTTLFLSIASMLISFCGGHFFILIGVVRDAWVFEYLVALLPITVFAMVQFPLYFDLFRAALKTAPESSYMATT
ncbi:hypothetical protein ACSBR1_032643 [Camellia fascicularis]